MQPGQGKELFETANTDIWLIDDSDNVPIQSALLASQIDFVEKIEATFVTNMSERNGRMSAMQQHAQQHHGVTDVFMKQEDSNIMLKAAHDRIIARLHSIVAVHVVAQTSERRLNALSSLLSTQLIHMRDISTHLLQSKVTSAESINWQFLPRQYLATNHTNSDVIVKIGKWEFPYGFEYQGAVARLGLTHFGEKSLFKLAYAMKNHFGARVHCEDSDNESVDVTKSLHFSCLANILGRQYVTVNCSSETHVETITKMLQQVIVCGSVCVLMSADKLSSGVVQNLCGVISKVREAWFDETCNIVQIPGASLNIPIKSKSSWLQYGFPFFVSTEDSSYPAAVSVELLSIFRVVAISTPNLSVLLSACLLAAGFVSCDSLSTILMEAVIAVSMELPDEVGPILYTTIAGAVNSASRFIDQERMQKSEIIMELENTNSVCWVEHNDAEEAKAVRNELVQHIYQQICNRPNAEEVRRKVEIVVTSVFNKFQVDHEDSQEKFNETEEDIVYQLHLLEKAKATTTKMNINPTQSQLEAMTLLYSQLKADSSLGVGRVTVLCGPSGSGKSVVWKAVCHMMTGDCKALQVKHETIANQTLSKNKNTEKVKPLEKAERSALKILQRNAKQFIRRKGLGATTVNNEIAMKNMAASPMHLEYMRVGR